MDQMHADERPATAEALELRVPDAAETLAAVRVPVGRVTCRDVARFWRSPHALLADIGAMLTPGGTLEFEDLVLPGGTAAAMFVDSLERLRSNAHVGARSADGWYSMIQASGLSIEYSSVERKWTHFHEWCDPSECDEALLDAVTALISRMPSEPAAWLSARWHGDIDPDIALRDQERVLAGFDRHFIRIVARKP